MKQKEFQKLIGQSLREIRKQTGKTQIEVCSKADITQTFLSQLESGNRCPSLNMLLMLASFYKCSVKEFFKYVK